MAGLKLMTYGGYVPRVAPHLLADNESQKAVNTKLYSGDLQSWSRPGSLTPELLVPQNTKTIYKGKTTTGDTRWISWTNDVDVARSPVPGNEQMNIYYTGDGVPKKTNSTLAGNSAGQPPVNYLNMGVPTPVAAPSVTRVGSGGSPETRVYVYTYIQVFGNVEEESAPSPVSVAVLCGTGDSITVSGFSAAPTANQNITKRRIYRSLSGTGSTQFQFVAEIPLATTSFSDNLPASALGENLETLNYLPPPPGLKGLVALPNGYLAGFAGQTLYMSEVNAPHAWPLEYQQDVGYDIVGLAVFGQSIAIMTEGYPYIASGVSPASVTIEKISILEPCIAKRSITSDNTGVTYASPNGLVGIGPGATGLMTANVMLRDDFAQFAPSTLRSTYFAGKYFGFYDSGSGVVTEGAFILDRNLEATPLSLTTLTADAAFTDPEDGNLYIVNENEIKLWEGDEFNRLPYEWLSKRFIFPAPANFGALEIDGDFDSIAETEALQQRIQEIIAANQALYASTTELKGALNAAAFNELDVNGSLLQNIPDLIDNRYLLVQVKVDGRVVHNRQYTSAGVFRMPAGFKGQAFEVQVNGNIQLRYLKMAETVKELKTL